MTLDRYVRKLPKSFGVLAADAARYVQAMDAAVAFDTLNAAGVSTEWMQKLQKRWIEFTIESLNRHRESLDAMYKSLIQVIEQASRLSEAKTPEDYRRTTDDLRHKMFETFKDQSEVQLREFHKSAEKWFECSRPLEPEVKEPSTRITPRCSGTHGLCESFGSTP